MCVSISHYMSIKTHACVYVYVFVYLYLKNPCVYVSVSRIHVCRSGFVYICIKNLCVYASVSQNPNYSKLLITK